MPDAWSPDLKIESSVISIDSNITRKVIKCIVGKVQDQEWNFEELQHELDILVKTFHPEPVEAVYYWEKKK